jgi:hypothetical protein
MSAEDADYLLDKIDQLSAPQEAEQEARVEAAYEAEYVAAATAHAA